MKYVIYARKSSEDKKKQVQSIPDQLEWARTHAKYRGLEVIREFTDVKTATVPGRDGFTAMVSYIFEQKEPMGIITWKADRLSRNPIDEGTIKYAFMKNTITHILSRDREFREGENQIIMGVEFGAATQYSIDLSRNVKRGLRSKVQKGWMPNLAPQGYRNHGLEEKGERKITPDPERFPLLQKIWKLFLTDMYSVEQLANILNDDWQFLTTKGNRMRTSFLYKIFLNPFYAGGILWNGEMYEGKHIPMITWAEYERAQQLLRRHDRPRPIRHKNPYSGLMKCGECGYSIIQEPTKKKVHPKTGKVSGYDYFRCSKRGREVVCSQPCLRKESLDAQVRDLLSEVSISKEFHSWAMAELVKSQGDNAQELLQLKKVTQKELNRVSAMMATAEEKLLQGVISDETYKTHKARLFGERSKLREKIQGIENQEGASASALVSFFEFAVRLRESFDHGDEDEKRRLLSCIGSNFVIKDRVLTADLKFPFSRLSEIPSPLTGSSLALEPSKNAYPEAISGASHPMFLRWREVIKDVRRYFTENGSHDWLIIENIRPREKA